MAETGGAVVHATSRDGTRIGLHRIGAGPPLVLVHGTAAAHWSFRFVAPLLAERFTVYAVDRRGRGESGDGSAYAIEREFEDVAAAVAAIGGQVAVFGHSFGATVALGAAALERNPSRLVLYEASPGIDVVADAELTRIEELLAAGDREEGLAAALRSFGLSPKELEQLRASPTWRPRLELAHTIPREARAEAGCRFDARRLGQLAAPVLLLLGEESPAWAAEGTERIRSALPGARVALLRGQGHAATVTAPELVADELARFLEAG